MTRESDRLQKPKSRMVVREGTVVIASVLVLAAGCGGNSASQASVSSSRSSGDEVVVPIDQQYESGLSGTATLSGDGNKTKVVIDLQSRSPKAGAPPRPAHIHVGSCENLVREPAYWLADVDAGSSTTTIDAKLSELYEGAFAVNVHESADRMDRYVACGDFGKGNDVSLPGYSHD